MTCAADLQWNSTVPVTYALHALGYRLADLAGMDSRTARSRAAGAWDANDRESNCAWRSIAVHLESEGR